MSRSLGGNATPLGSQRRRLAPLTGSAVWGQAIPRRKLPLGKVNWFGSGLADSHSLLTSGLPEDFHFLGSQNLAAPPPPQIPARLATREPEVGDSGAPRAEAAAQVKAAACGARRMGGLGSSLWSLAAWLGLAGYLPPTCGSPASARALCPRRRVSEGLRSAPSPHLPGKSPK